MFTKFLDENSPGTMFFPGRPQLRLDPTADLVARYLVHSDGVWNDAAKRASGKWVIFAR